MELKVVLAIIIILLLLVWFNRPSEHATNGVFAEIYLITEDYSGICNSCFKLSHDFFETLGDVPGLKLVNWTNVTDQADISAMREKYGILEAEAPYMIAVHPKTGKYKKWEGDPQIRTGFLELKIADIKAEGWSLK